MSEHPPPLDCHPESEAAVTRVTGIKLNEFAVKAVEHAQTYWNLLGAIPPRTMKLTAIDDELYEGVTAAFPPLDSEKAAEGVYHPIAV